MNRRRMILLSALVASVVGLGTLAWIGPMADTLRMEHFNRQNSSSQSIWKAYGGAWQLANGAVSNNSGDRGTKLVAGSTDWRNYTFSVELHFDGDHGDMGVIMRSSHEEEGVDAYDGYYVGLRTTDGTLVLGRSDYGWSEALPTPMPGGVHASAWYRLTVTAVDCHIAAASENLSTGQRVYAALADDQCLQSGRIGLRSLATGGTWRNIRVNPATLADYQQLAAQATAVRTLEFPRREADYNRIFHFSPAYVNATTQPQKHTQATAHISELRQLPRNVPTPTHLNGLVTLTTPALYVQDAEGAVRVNGVQSAALSVGDAVEVSGLATNGAYSATIDQASTHLLWSGTPAPPIAVTPAQAASGAYDAEFVETEARLNSMTHDAEGNLLLDFADSTQNFEALLSPSMAHSLTHMELNSLVRIRGICVLDRALTHDRTPFVLLPRSADDVVVIASAPWWTPLHVALVAAAALLLLLLAQMIYYRMHQWRASAVTHERERLAHEIHDTMAQSFAGVGYQIQGIRSGVLRGDRTDQSQIAEQLSVAYQLVRRCHEEASRTISMLGAPSPEAQNNLLGLLAATARRIAGCPIDIRTAIEGNVYPLHLRQANALLMIGQEAISNALGHGQATALALTLRLKNDRIELAIEDNGAGFDPTPEVIGFGLQGMQKRARDIGGKLEIASTPDKGTTIRIHAPMHREGEWERLGMRISIAWLRVLRMTRAALQRMVPLR